MDWARIMAPLGGDAEDETVLTAGAHLATLFKAELTAAFAPPDLADLIPWMSDGMVGGVELGAIEAVRAASVEGQQAARAHFERCAASRKSFIVLESPVAPALALEARLSDVVVFGPTTACGRNRLGEAFQDVVAVEQRPTLVAKQPLGALSTVIVAWNGGKEASRAVRTALPLLRKAGRVVIVTVADQRTKALSPQKLADFLIAHGVTSEVRAVEGDVAGVILSEAASLRAELVVFGAYGHTRLRDFVFGSVTRTLLQADGPSLFISH